MKAAKSLALMLGIACLCLGLHLPARADAIGPFGELRDITFSFSSGVGGWGTHLWIAPDGTFWGQYHDSDMGTTGEGYPLGTVYRADFTGVFSDAVKVDPYTYQFRMDYVTLLETPGNPGRIMNEIMYVPSEAYGLDGGEYFNL